MNELRIVVGDDQALMRNALRFALEADGGCSVAAEATSGAELLEILRRVEADVVLMDLTMPPLDGLECLEHLREEHPELVLIVVSGCDDPRQIDAAFRRGANAFVLKSIDPSDLPALIRQTIEGSAFVMARTDEERRFGGRLAPHPHGARTGCPRVRRRGAHEQADRDAGSGSASRRSSSTCGTSTGNSASRAGPRRFGLRTSTISSTSSSN